MKKVEKFNKLRREFLRDLKDEAGGACCICGYNKNYASLEFHLMLDIIQKKHWLKKQEAVFFYARIVMLNSTIPTLRRYHLWRS